MDAIVTVITPTYNRAHTLGRLYQSLVAQSVSNFEWMIVDDGSTDDTQAIVNGWIQEGRIPIHYYWKENGGKHRALNFGCQFIATPLTFIVDSDDWLDSRAVEVIGSYYDKYKGRLDICGFSFLRKFPDETINGKRFSEEERVDTYLNVRIWGNDIYSDKAEVFLTQVLKENPFPEFPGEKFLGEDILWIALSSRYAMVHINQAIYIGDYQTDGLTQNRRKHNIDSPVGCFHRSNAFLEHKLPVRFLIKNILQVIVYGKFAGYSFGKITAGRNYHMLRVLMYPAGCLIYRKWKRL